MCSRINTFPHQVDLGCFQRLRQSLEQLADNILSLPLDQWTRQGLVSLATYTDPGFVKKNDTKKSVVIGGFFAVCMVFSEYGVNQRQALRKLLYYHGHTVDRRQHRQRHRQGAPAMLRSSKLAALNGRILRDLPAWLLRHLFPMGGIKRGTFHEMFMQAMAFNGLSYRGRWMLRGLLSTTAGIQILECPHPPGKCNSITRFV